MTHEDIMDTIKNSSPTDWIHNDKREVWTYKKDIKLRFKEKWEERPFKEEWVQKFPDKIGFKVTYIISYGDAFIQEFIAVSVDGHRTIIPLPKSQNNLVITPWQYHIGKIVEKDPNSFYSLDYQMERAGIKVE